MWMIAYEEIFEVFSLDESLVIDADKPISTISSGVIEIEIVAPTATTIPFTAAELLGTWSISGITSDDASLSEACALVPTDFPCSDLIVFNADGTAFAEQSGRSAVWSVNDSGAVELLFVDNGTQLTITRVQSGEQFSSALLHYDDGENYRADVDIMIKRDIPPLLTSAL